MAKLDTKVLESLNAHIGAELASSYEYLAAASYMTEEGLDGMAKWLRLQSDEERSHAMRFYEHVHERQGRVHLVAIPAPPEKYDGPADVFQQALRREQDTTKHIHELYKYALEKHDYPLQIFLQWFIQEQVREENGIQNIVDRLELIGEDKAALVILNQELASRSLPDT